MSAQNGGTRKRVYGRVRTEVDGRTGGIRTATRTTYALGGTQSSQVVHTTAERQESIWASFLPALDNLMQFGARIIAKRDSEAERLRLKAEHEADARVDALQAWEGTKWAGDITAEMTGLIDQGQLQNERQLTAWLQDRTAGLNETEHASFITSAHSILKPVLLTGLERMAQKNKENFNNYTSGRVADGLATVFQNYNEADVSGEANRILHEELARGAEILRLAGKSDAEIDDAFRVATAASAKSLITTNPFKAQALVEQLRTRPGNAQWADALQTELESKRVEWEEREAARSDRDEQKFYEANLAEVYTATAGENVDALHRRFDRAVAEKAEMTALLGDNGYVKYVDSLRRDLDYLQSEESEKKRQEFNASALRSSELVAKMFEGRSVSLQDVDDANLLGPHRAEALKALMSEKRQQAEALRPQARSLLENAWEPGLGTARLELSALDQMDPAQMQHYETLIFNAMAGVDRAAYGDDAASYTAEIVRTGKEKLAEIMAGAPGTVYKNPFAPDPAQAASPVKLAAMTFAEYQEDEAGNEARLRAALFTGKKEAVGVDPATNRTVFKTQYDVKTFTSISDPEIRSLASAMIDVEDVRARAREQTLEAPRTWLQKAVDYYTGAAPETPAERAEREKEARERMAAEQAILDAAAHPDAVFMDYTRASERAKMEGKGG